MDYLLMVGGCLGGMIALGSTFVGPYLRGAPAGTINWPERKYYVKKVTDKSMIPSANWKMLKLEICQKYDMAQQKFGNPAAQAAMAAFGAVTGGMSVPMCDVKAACREHLSNRCVEYGYMVFNGMLLHGTQFLGLCCFGCAGMCLMVSSKLAWKFNAACCGALGVFFAGGGFGFWLFDSGRMMKALSKDTVWPLPKPYGAGFGGNAFGLVLMTVGTLCGFIGAQPESKPAEDDMMGDPMMGEGMY